MSTERPRTFFRCHPAEEDPGVLLDPDEQVTEPWGEPEHGPAAVVRAIRDRIGEETE